MSDIQIFKTNEIPDDIWQQISDGYLKCFGLNLTIDELKKSFRNTITGESLHALKISENGNVVGHNYYQPIPYILKGRKILCALSGGTYVLPEYRNDFMIFHDMIKALDSSAKHLGWSATLGIPNENSFKYAVKINKYKKIGQLSYYILPIHIGKIIKGYKVLNHLSFIYSKLSSYVYKLSTILYNPKEKDKPLHINCTKEFKNIRLNSDNYINISRNNIEGTYRIYDENGIRTAYILTFSEKGRRSAKSLSFIVEEILKREQIDAIIYIGTMNFFQTILTKVPRKYEPQAFPLCIRIIDKSDEDLNIALTSINNVDFGLINFDVR